MVYDVSDWVELFAIHEPVYVELCLEFYSTIELLKAENLDEILLRFRLGGQLRSMSLRDMALCLGIYDEEVCTAPYFDTYIWGGHRMDEGFAEGFSATKVWGKLISVPYMSGGNASSALTEVDLRLIQKFIAHSIACR